MSTTEQELTDEEAAALNAQLGGEDGEPDDEPGTEPEPEPEPAPTPPSDVLTPEEVERRYRAVKQSFRNYSGVVERQLDFLEGRIPRCPLCKDDHPGYVDLADAGKYPQGLIDAVQTFLGFSVEIDYEQDPDVRTCPKCGGEGMTKTGSRVTTARKKLCSACVGWGFVPPPDGDAVAAPIAAPVMSPVTEQVAPLNQEERDPWGDPRILPDGRENPNYGKMPQFKVPIQPWGVTAGLTAQHAAA